MRQFCELPREYRRAWYILEEGRKLAQRSLAFGIIGIVTYPLITFSLPYSLLESFIRASWESCLHEMRNVAVHQQSRAYPLLDWCDSAHRPVSPGGYYPAGAYFL